MGEVIDAVAFDSKLWTRQRAEWWLRAHRMRPAGEPAAAEGASEYRLRKPGRSVALFRKYRAKSKARGVPAEGITYVVSAPA